MVKFRKFRFKNVEKSGSGKNLKTRKRGNCEALQLEASRSGGRPPHALYRENFYFYKVHLALTKRMQNFNFLALNVSEI